jgi:hypothetical protein
MINRRPLAQALIAIALIGGSAGAQAADSMSTRVASSLGRWIAAQGDAALNELSEDLKQSLSKTLKPLLPAQDSVVAEPHESLHKVGNDGQTDASNNAEQSL